MPTSPYQRPMTPWPALAPYAGTVRLPRASLQLALLARLDATSLEMQPGMF